MKQLVFFMHLLPLSALAQISWNYLPYAPITHRFDDIYFANDSTGWAVNGDGKIYNT